MPLVDEAHTLTQSRSKSKRTPCRQRDAGGKCVADGVERRARCEVVIACRLAESGPNGRLQRIEIDDAKACACDRRGRGLVSRAKTWLEVVQVTRIGEAVVVAGVLQTTIEREAG